VEKRILSHCNIDRLMYNPTSSMVGVAMLDAMVVWDEEDKDPCNVTHIAEHGLTQEEVEDVLLNDDAESGTSQSSGRPCKFGYTRLGKFIIVVFEVVCEGPQALYPITA